MKATWKNLNKIKIKLQMTNQKESSWKRKRVVWTVKKSVTALEWNI